MILIGCARSRKKLWSRDSGSAIKDYHSNHKSGPNASEALEALWDKTSRASYEVDIRPLARLWFQSTTKVSTVWTIAIFIFTVICIHILLIVVCVAIYAVQVQVSI